MEFLQISLTGWVALSIALSMGFLGSIMFILGRERAHYVWGGFCIAVAIWAAGFYMVSLAQTPEAAQYWWKISYIGLILNPFLYFQFALEFIENTFFLRHRWIVTLAINAVAALFLYLDLATNLIIDRVSVLFGQLYYNKPPGALYLYFMALFLLLVVWSLILIFSETRRRKRDSFFRQRAVYFFIASAVAYIGGSMNFLPVYGIQVNPTTNFAVAFGAIFIAYAILRRGLFDVKVVMAQFLTLTLAVLALVRLLISRSPQEAVFNLIILAITLAVGIYLILSVKREVAQRERIEKLARELEETNKRQEGLIHFIGHEVKGFLTKAQGALSMLVEGDFGALPQEALGVATQALHETQDGVTSVSEILKAANLKRGTVEFHKEPFDLKVLAAESVEKARSAAKAKGLALSFSAEDGDFTFVGDEGEIGSHVLRNLIDNAINYTPSGSIDVSLKKAGDRYLFVVKDTGVGISDEDRAHLFTEGGHGKDSQRVNVHSTGYGLYIAKQVAEAQGGTIRAESDGPGKGSAFTVEFPAS